MQFPGGRLVAILVRRQEPQIKRRRVIVSAADRPAGTRLPTFEQKFIATEENIVAAIGGGDTGAVVGQIFVRVFYAGEGGNAIGGTGKEVGDRERDAGHRGNIVIIERESRSRRRHRFAPIHEFVDRPGLKKHRSQGRDRRRANLSRVRRERAGVLEAGVPDVDDHRQSLIG